MAGRKGRARGNFNISQIGLAAGVFLVVGASAYMNVSGWYAIAETVEQRVANVALASGFELTALFMLPHAGRLVGRGTYAKALMALGIGAFAVGVNIYATQTFLLDQIDLAGNEIETAQIDAGTAQERIADLQNQQQAIIDRNDGVPRTKETLRDAGRHFDDENNPINARERDREIGDRREYDRLQSEIDGLRDQRDDARVPANDEVRTVIPREETRNFVTALEVMKAFGLFVVGNNRLYWGPSKRKRRNEKFITPEMERDLR
ncbi:MAG: hypothetical protein AAFQ29_13360 [Pseudomonadota bacterium]